MFQFGAKLTSAFFDSEKVLAMMDKKSRQALSKIGAYVRRTARGSLRYSNGPSSPGAPPHVHRGKFTKTTVNRKTGVSKSQAASPLRELWFFGVDLESMSVVCGPALFKRSNRVAAALERGGLVPISIRDRGKVERKTIRIAARPTAVPAMEANLPVMADAWK